MGSCGGEEREREGDESLDPILPEICYVPQLPLYKAINLAFIGFIWVARCHWNPK